MREQPALPEMPAAGESTAAAPIARSAQRVARPVRDQVELIPCSLDEGLAADHPARAIWAMLELKQVDLEPFYTRIRAAIDGPGRSASDPQVMLALWAQATADGIASARLLARLTESHAAYRWLRGRVPLNYHLLSDFRVAYQAELDELLAKLVAVLQHQGLVTLERTAQDGLRVRASAGASSFRRRPTLERCLQEAREQVARLAQEREHPDPQLSRREQAARERAARERQERVEQAVAELSAVEAIKAKQRQKLGKARQARVSEPRVSTTDPQARVMKMPDGGFRPAYNVQLVTDADSRVVVGVQVCQQGSDGGLAAPLEAQVAERCGQHPAEYLLDGGLATRDDITTLAGRGVTVYAPVEPPRTETSGRSAYQPRPDDSPAVREWRQRMGTEAGKAIYRQRASTAEWTNAQWRERQGLRRVTVRGVAKVTSVMLLMAITHNLLRWIAMTS